MDLQIVMALIQNKDLNTTFSSTLCCHYSIFLGLYFCVVRVKHNCQVHMTMNSLVAKHWGYCQQQHACSPDIVSQRSWVRYPVWPHTFLSPSADSRRAVVSYWRKYVHEVLVIRLGCLSLPRKSVVRVR